MMMEDMFGYNAPKVCANMYHKDNENVIGDLISHPIHQSRRRNKSWIHWLQ